MPEPESTWVPEDLSQPQGGLMDTLVLFLAGYGAYHLAGLLSSMLKKSRPVHE